jgi:hypothetical protein
MSPDLPVQKSWQKSAIVYEVRALLVSTFPYD